ncbi:MAG TPA: hypothetical protein PKC87_06345, partial [Candidatus Absconditabacterales bacterium]|nr:hypothetical protein [Candidatus Absconditabacterales bacterium]
VSSGNLTINPLSCDIAQNESTCTVTGATWTTTNAIQPSLVDENTGTVLSTSANNSDPLRVWVAYPQTDFALRHTGFPGVLDTERVTAKCVNGTSWVDGKCVAILGGLSGSIDASDCTILEGESTCLSNISWSTINPILGETSSVTTPVNITIADENNGDKSYEMDRGSRYFYLYHNGLELGRDESIAECINGTSWVDGKCTFSGGGGGDPIDGLCGYPHNDCDAGTSFDLQDSVNTYMWQCLGQLGGNDSPICTENIVGGGSGDTIDIDFTANPKRIFKGRSSTLRWVTDADSCTGTANDGSPFVTEDKPNGTYIVKPNQTTIYTLSCKKTGVSDASQEAEVKVNVIKFFEI